jgi:hypothetical protein
MATLTSEQILALLEASGGDLSVLSKQPKKSLSKRAILSALIKSPETLAAITQKAHSGYDKYSKFDTGQIYDPVNELNSVEAKYRSMGPKYGQFATKFWNDVRQLGATSGNVSAVLNKIDEQKNVLLPQYGLSEGEYTDLKDQFTKDTNAFQTAEAARNKAQYKAFVDKRKTLGIEPDANVDAANQFVYQQTGLRGLASMPTSLDQFIKRKSFRFRKALEKSGDSGAVARLQPLFEQQLREKLGKGDAYKKYAFADVIKQSLKGK